MLYKKLSRSNIVIFCVLILAFILRIIYLGSKSLWLDEAVNVLMADKSAYSWNNSLPPLYFAVLHFWLAIGKSEFSVRFLSVILGVFSVYMIYKIGNILYGEKEAIVSAFLMSISQIMIVFSQQVLYYSLFIPFSLLSVYFFLRMQDEHSYSNKILFLVSIVLSFYAHYFIMLLLFVFMIYNIYEYVMEKKNPEGIKSFFLLLGIFLILIAPILPLVISQTIIKTEASNINFDYQTHISVNFMKEIFTYLIISDVHEKEGLLPYLIMGLFFYGVFSSLEYREKSLIFLMMWLFIPIISALVLSNIISNLQIRYIIFILPSLLLLSSRGIVAIPDGINYLIRKAGVPAAKIPVKLNVIYIIAILIIIVFSTYPNLKFYYGSKNYDWREAAEFIEKNAEVDSNIILAPGYNSFPFSYYYIPKNKTNVIEYTNFNSFMNLSNKNNTYLIITVDINVLKPDERYKLLSWTLNKPKVHLSNIDIFKNVTTNQAIDQSQ